MKVRLRGKSAIRSPISLRMPYLLLIGLLTNVFVLVGCSSCTWNIDIIDYAPLPGGDWAVSTPKAEGIDPMHIAELYFNASKLETMYGLVVVKNGQLIAERYFHDSAVDQKELLQSVSKSFTSALVGIALDQGFLTSVDQKMMEFFPELSVYDIDPRKEDITIRQLLQMRAGYTWEESSQELFELLYTGFRPSTLVTVPLAYDPGTDMAYSNLSSHLLAIIVARAVGTDLKTFAEANLFSHLNAEIGDPWYTDWEGYYIGHGGMRLTARDAAKFGFMYLNGGVYEGTQVISAEWVEESLKTYTADAWDYRVGRNFKDIGYGYQWWSARSGDYNYNLAWGHGGQLIVIVDELDLVVVVTSDPFEGDHSNSWKHEKANINTVANFIASIQAD